MKRLLVVLVSLAGILILVGVILLFPKNGSGPGNIFQVKENKRQYVSRIVFKEDTATLILEKEKTGWMVDHRWPVRSRSIKVLKKVLSRMEVKSPVSEELVQQVIADTSGRHVEVSIFRRVFPVKRFEVYTSARIPGEGAMMRLARKKKWYIVYLPVEQLNPAVFFITDPYYWRDPALFNYRLSEVQEVQMEYGDHSGDGYRVGIDTLTHRYYFFPDDSSFQVRKVDTTRVRTYLTYFQHLECDEWDRSLTPASRDSVLHQKPLYILNVVDFQGEKFSMRIYSLPNRQPVEGSSACDPDVARAWVTPLNEMVLIRYYRIDPLLQEAEWFICR